MKANKIIISPILFVIAVFIFTVLDVGMKVDQINQLVQPLFFAATFTLSVLFANFRKYLLICSGLLLILLVITYMLQMLVISDWVGRLGFGMLLIILFSYFPQLIKRGYIEKF